ncbi:TPA: HAMP domain-containing histidine kinase [Candidatus Poribacteria bacterium]|nr:HAMP domain-containing histidine kinase [Candidatus Poribacteria bacterium]
MMLFGKGKLAAKSAASGFLLAYTIVGIFSLSCAFVYYTRQIIELNRNLEKQVTPLANLVAEIPSLKEVGLQNRLNEFVVQSLPLSRLSFIITDNTGERIITARGINPAIEKKLNAEPQIPFSAAEQKRVDDILSRMKSEGKVNTIRYMVENRKTYGYIYHGETDVNAIDQLPFVFTDLGKTPQKWQIWGDLIQHKDSQPNQVQQAQQLIRNSISQDLFVPIQTTPLWETGYFYYQKVPYYGLIIMPIVLIAVFSVFLASGFAAFRQIKSFEQTAIWCGLAKETAHQLGTPISSLIGWIELLGEQNIDKDNSIAGEIYDAMRKDTDRLQSITKRFSHIGSDPSRSKTDVNQIIDDVVEYFQRRLPRHSNQVKITVNHGNLPEITANRELLQWVLENLVRNSLDAMDKPSGIIGVKSEYEGQRNQIVIKYHDNGKGIQRGNQKKIFQPGMTTKKHGWGMGLALVKRIIEEYHKGQIKLIKSDSQGTQFNISLPVGAK